MPSHDLDVLSLMAGVGFDAHLDVFVPADESAIHLEPDDYVRETPVASGSWFAVARSARSPSLPSRVAVRSSIQVRQSLLRQIAVPVCVITI